MSKKALFFVLILLLGSIQAQRMWHHPSYAYDSWKGELNRIYTGQAWLPKFEESHQYSAQYAGMRREETTIFFGKNNKEIKTKKSTTIYNVWGKVVYEETPQYTKSYSEGAGWRNQDYFDKRKKKGRSFKTLFTEDSLLTYEDRAHTYRNEHYVYTYTADKQLTGRELWRNGKPYIHEEYLLQSDSLNKVRLTHSGKVYEAAYYLKPWPNNPRATYCHEMRVFHQGQLVYRRTNDVIIQDSLFKQKEAYYNKGRLEGTTESTMVNRDIVISYYDAKGKLLGGRVEKTEAVCPGKNGEERQNRTTNFIRKNGSEVSTLSVGYTPDCESSILEQRHGKHVYKTISYQKDGMVVRRESYEDGRLTSRTDYTLTAAR